MDDGDDDDTDDDTDDGTDDDDNDHKKDSYTAAGAAPDADAAPGSWSGRAVWLWSGSGMALVWFCSPNSFAVGVLAGLRATKCVAPWSGKTLRKKTLFF